MRWTPGPYGDAPPPLEDTTALIYRATGKDTAHNCRICALPIRKGELLVLRYRTRTIQHAGCVCFRRQGQVNPELLPPGYGKRVVVTGGRNFRDHKFLAACLRQATPISVLAHGGASGADMLAGAWARERRIPLRVYEANWYRFGRRAGPERNARMLDHFAPDLVVAFEGGPGTANCIRAADERGVPVWKTWEAPINPALVPKMARTD